MEERIIPFGTTHNVTVDSASVMMIVVIADEINEGFVLTGHGMEVLPKKDDKGTIVFERGGPLGGYWKYLPKKPDSEN